MEAQGHVEIVLKMLENQGGIWTCSDGNENAAK